MNENGTVLLANPRGFCAGVVRAIDIVNLALARYGTPIYVRREIVHNKYVVGELRNKGVVFVEGLDEVPEGGRVIFSAHGVSPDVRAEARLRGLQVIDATCPLVTKVHLEAIRYARAGFSVILIGHADHDEVTGTYGEAPAVIKVIGSAEEAESVEISDPAKVAYLTQTTLSLDDTRQIINRLRLRFPLIQGPATDDICYATQNRQNIVAQLARASDLVLVVGSANSSNSRRLVEVARSHGAPARLIDNVQDIDPDWLIGVQKVGLTAGASAPEALVDDVVRYLGDHGYRNLETFGSIEERVEFSLPPEVRP
jgi:4-hydroxy-3-methylbut-2-enyl diphosphate reductase